MKKSIKTCAAALLAVGLSGGAASAEDFKIGLLLPFSGVYAGLGDHIEKGFALGLEHFGGDLGDNSITLFREDTEAKPAVGLAKARKLVLQDKVDAMVGIVSSAVLGAVRDFAEGSKVPVIVANAGNNDMTGQRCSPYVLRVSFSNAQMNRPMGDYMADKGLKRVHLMAPDYAAGHQMMNAFKETFEAKGGEIVGETYTPLHGTKDYAPFISAAKATDPDAIYVFYAGGAAIAFVKQYHDFGVKEEVPLYGAGFLTSPAYVQVQGEAADGITVGLHYVPSIDTPENERFQSAYQAAHGKTGSEFAVAGYDAARMVIEAIKASGGDKEAFDKALATISFDGPRGPLRLDPATNNVVQNIYIFENRFVGDKVEQVVLETIPDVQDAPNGCAL
ncbi:MAG: ABC transporter substrate-binding protein [Rhodospirillales bacterium]